MNIIEKLRLLARFHFTDRPYDGPEPEPRLTIVPLGLKLDEFYQFLTKPRASFTIDQLDSLQYRDETFPIYCLDYQPRPKAKPTVKILVVSGSHGNEQAGILSLRPIIEHLSWHQKQYQHVAVRVIAPHNPVSAQYFSRFNQDGVDVNRDFKKQATRETRAVTRAFREFGPDFCLSLHEGPQAEGTFLYTNKLVDQTIVDTILADLTTQKVALASKSYFGNRLRTPGQFRLDGAFLLLTKLWSGLFGFQSFGAYCTAQRTPAIIIETPWSNHDPHQRIDAHCIVFKSLLKQL